MLDRCNRLMTEAQKQGLDAVLVMSQINWRYFSGFTGSNAILLITPERILGILFRRISRQMAFLRSLRFQDR